MAEVPEHLLQRSASRRAALTGGEAPAEGGLRQLSPRVATRSLRDPPRLPGQGRPDPARVRRARRQAAIPACHRHSQASHPRMGDGCIGGHPGVGSALCRRVRRPSVARAEVVDGSALYGSNARRATVQPVAAVSAPSSTAATSPRPSRRDAGREAHIEWVANGSGAFKGKGYGDPNREGGQHIATSGGMPGFGGKLSAEEIEAIVDYERDGL